MSLTAWLDLRMTPIGLRPDLSDPAPPLPSFPSSTFLPSSPVLLYTVLSNILPPSPLLLFSPPPLFSLIFLLSSSLSSFFSPLPFPLLCSFLFSPLLSPMLFPVLSSSLFLLLFSFLFTFHSIDTFVFIPFMFLALYFNCIYPSHFCRLWSFKART